MSAQAHPAAPHHLPAFITAPGETDVLLVVTAVMLIVIVLIFGNLFLKLHTLPERLAHKRHKLQFEIVAVLGLLALFTHIHTFWVAGLLLALVDLPGFRDAARPDGKLAREDRRTARRADPGDDAVDPSPPDRGAAESGAARAPIIRRRAAPPSAGEDEGPAPARARS